MMFNFYIFFYNFIIFSFLYFFIGGLFEYVSGANFFGEVVEWSGFALAGWSIPGAAFAIFTLLVLSSRAKQHHQ